MVAAISEGADEVLLFFRRMKESHVGLLLRVEVRHSTLNKRTPVNKPIVSIVFLVLLSFCLLLLYVSCVFYTK